jgi:PadR family transcriptional regulator PadR
MLPHYLRAELRLPRHLPYVKLSIMKEVRITVAVAAVLRIFLEDPSKTRHGFELMKATSFPSGKLYPILARLAQAGWLERKREDIDPVAAGRPARYLYRINPEGVESARLGLAEVSRAHLRVTPKPRPAFRERPA